MVKKLYVDNFKSLNGFEMDFEPFTVVVGNNMSGKSTVLQALDFLANTVRDDFRVILERRGWSVSDVKSQLQKSSRLIFRCELELPDNGRKRLVEWELQIQMNISKNGMELIKERVQCKTEEKTETLLSYGLTEEERFLCEKGKKEILPRLQSGASVLKLMDLRNYPVLAEVKRFFENSDSFELLSPEKMRSSSRGEVRTIGSAGEKLPSFIRSMNGVQKKQFLTKLRRVLGDKIVDVEAVTKGKPGWTQLVTKENFQGKIFPRSLWPIPIKFPGAHGP